MNEAHVRRTAGGRLVLIDIFCLDGAALYRQILEDVSRVHRRMIRTTPRNGNPPNPCPAAHRPRWRPRKSMDVDLYRPYRVEVYIH